MNPVSCFGTFIALPAAAFYGHFYVPFRNQKFPYNEKQMKWRSLFGQTVKAIGGGRVCLTIFCTAYVCDRFLWNRHFWTQSRMAHKPSW